MEKFVGHIVANATHKSFESGKTVVNFTIADNESIPDGTGGFKNDPRYIECSYWVSPAIAQHLTKGRPIQVEGRISSRGYTHKANGLPMSVLTLRIQTIKFLSSGPKPEDGKPSPLRVVPADLPF